jgi:hypothetical protein
MGRMDYGALGFLNVHGPFDEQPAAAAPPSRRNRGNAEKPQRRRRFGKLVSRHALSRVPSAHSLKIPPVATRQRMREPSSHNNEIDAGIGDVTARLERYDGGKRWIETLAQRSLDEPVSPELVLVDPDLARRAREHLSTSESVRRVPLQAQPSASEVELPRFQTTAQPTPEFGRRERPRKPRLAVGIAVVSILTLAVGFAITRVRSTKNVSSQSRETSVDPDGGGRPSANQSRGAHDARLQRTAKTQTTKHEKRRPRTRSTERKILPSAPPAAGSARVFGWVAAPGAAFYLVRFYNEGKEIFRAQPTAPRLLLPARWSFHGQEYTLAPGHYRWSVQPGYGPRSRPRYGQPIVRARLVIRPTQ